jgi:RND family efflux transporter MFP subunit
VAGALALTFIGWTGTRVNSAMKSKAAVSVERDAVAAKAKEEAAKPREVKTLQGKDETAVPAVSFEGSLMALAEADVGFKVGGRLAIIKADVGDRVKRGEVLAQLDAGEAAAQVKAAEAGLRASDAQLALAADSEARTQKVVSAGVQPESVGVQATQQKSLAEANRDGANAQLLLARQSLSNQTLVAPFDGIVTRAPHGTGGVVSPGTALFHVADLSSLKVVGSISASDAEFVRNGGDVEILSGGRVAAHAKITALVAALDETTKRMPVQALIENGAESGLVAGTLVRAQIRGGTPVPVVRLPHTVLKPGSQDEIFVVEQDKLVARRIAATVAPDGALLVRSGVTSSEAVLDQPWAEAKTGTPVRSTK